MIKDKRLAESIATSYNVGYWEVSDTFFFNKADALRFATSIGIHNIYDVKYHFYDNIYNSIDWTQLSPYSFDELSKQRAQQLRDTYKYLTISFSGGSDSTHVLNTFLKNNIPIDEVITFGRLTEAERTQAIWSPHDRSPKNFIYEYTATTKPFLQKLSNNYPNIKITTIDVSESAIHNIYNGKSIEYALAGMIMTPGMMAHTKVKDHVAKHGITAAIVYGVDKPRLGYDISTDKFFTFFHDFTTFLGNWVKKPGDLTNHEYFFYTPHMPELLVNNTIRLKQALYPIITNPNHIAYDLISFQGKTPNIRIIDVHSDICKKILYPDWDIQLYQTKKLSSFMWPEYTDSLFYKKRAKDYWVGQVSEFVHGISPNLLDIDKSGNVHKLKDCFTQIRYL